MNSKIVFTVPEIANILGINRAAAYDLTRREGFPAIRVTPRRIVIPVEAFNRWLNEQTARDSAPAIGGRR